MKNYFGLIGLIGLLGLLGPFSGGKVFGGYYNLQRNASVVTTTFSGLSPAQLVYGDQTGLAGQTSNLVYNPMLSSLDLVGSMNAVTGTFTGNVGIGTTTPTSIFQVTSGSSTTTVKFGGPENGAKPAIFCQWNGSSWSIWGFMPGATTTMVVTGPECQ